MVAIPEANVNKSDELLLDKELDESDAWDAMVLDAVDARATTKRNVRRWSEVVKARSELSLGRYLGEPKTRG